MTVAAMQKAANTGFSHSGGLSISRIHTAPVPTAMPIMTPGRALPILSSHPLSGKFMVRLSEGLDSPDTVTNRGAGAPADDGPGGRLRTGSACLAMPFQVLAPADDFGVGVAGDGNCAGAAGALIAASGTSHGFSPASGLARGVYHPPSHPDISPILCPLACCTCRQTAAATISSASPTRSLPEISRGRSRSRSSASVPASSAARVIRCTIGETIL